MRRKLVELDLLECVLGLGPNLFYNSPMEACVVICRAKKPPARRGKVLFIDAVNEVARERAQSYLKPEHQARILAAYMAFGDELGFTKVASTEEILEKDGNLSIPRYVRPVVNGNWNGGGDARSLKKAWAAFEASGREFWEQLDELVKTLGGVVGGEAGDA
jgi:type I restriction enzyme M protein